MSARSRKAHPAANPPSRDTQLAAMPDEYVVGRAFGHAWEIEMSWGAKIGNVHHVGWATVIKKCRDCPYRVVQILDAQMGLVEENREYPPGYQILGQGRTEWRKEARRELMSRLAHSPQRPAG